MSAEPRPSLPDASPALKETAYEFEDAHKESFRALAASMSFVGVCAMLLGVLSCAFFAGELYAGSVAAAVGMASLAGLSVAPLGG